MSQKHPEWKQPQKEAQQMFEWFIHDILVLWQQGRCAVWSVSSSSLLVRESLCRFGHDLWEKELWRYYLCTFCPLDCISSSIFPVLRPRLSLSCHSSISFLFLLVFPREKSNCSDIALLWLRKLNAGFYWSFNFVADVSSQICLAEIKIMEFNNSVSTKELWSFW